MTWGLLAAATVAFLLALAAIAAISRGALAARLVDRPNERSLHQRPTPRVGGIGLLCGVAAAMVFAGVSSSLWLFLVALVLAVISAMDDAESLPVATRLGAHLVAAAMAVVIVGPATQPMWGGNIAAGLAALLAIAWMSNLYNFMDGADGLAGGMAAIGFAAFAIAAQGVGAQDLAILCGALSAASVAFLAFNAPPAKVFMGDAGSVPLGFLAGALGWYGTVRGAWPAWFPALVFSPFIVDATLTLARRAAAGEAVWKAHRSHYYQRLVLGGWSHRRLALSQWALMGAVAASAIVAREQSATGQGAILAAWLLAYGVIAIAVDTRHPRHSTP